MKIEVLKEYIKQTVREEIKNILKDELKYQLTEMLLNNNTSSQPSKSLQKPVNVIESEQVVSKTTPPKKTVKYTDNPVLNEVLNETVCAIPQEGQMVGLLGNGFNTSQSEQINEVKVPDNAPEPVKTVFSAMNRDYRALMKAVDKKKSGK